MCLRRPRALCAGWVRTSRKATPLPTSNTSVARWTGAKVDSNNSWYSIGKDGRTGTFASQDDGFCRVNGFTSELNVASRGKHIPRHGNYALNQGGSILKDGLAHAQELIEKFAGSESRHGAQKGLSISAMLSACGPVMTVPSICPQRVARCTTGRRVLI